MSRFTALTSILTAGLALALAPAALAQGLGGPDSFAPPPPVDAKQMAASIRAQMSGNAFGYQFAIAQDGKLVPGNNTDDKRAGGFARSDADTPGVGGLPMTNTMRYELASFTKNPVALSTMKLLRRHGLTIKSPIEPWLPADWKRGAAFKSMTFEHLLGHTSGINQALTAKKADMGDDTKFNSLYNNTWTGLKNIVELNPTLNSDRSYKNANYGILGILNATMWRAEGGFVLGFGGPAPIRETSYSLYAQQFMQWNILGPAGIPQSPCTGDKATDGLNYAAGATQSSKGSLLAWPALNCAGNAGLRLSATEMVRYLAHLRHGNIVHPDDLKTMDDLRLGWSAENNLSGEPATARWHGGAFNGDGAPQVWTCGMTFGDGTEAALIVNSPLKDGKDACDVLLAGYQAGK